MLPAVSIPQDCVIPGHRSGNNPIRETGTARSAEVRPKVQQGRAPPAGYVEAGPRVPLGRWLAGCRSV